MLPLLFLLSVGLTACSSWELVWSDEFNGPVGSGPDTSKWEYDLGGGGWGNHELEYYTDRSENVSTDGNGNLVITALSVNDSQASGLSCWYGACQFTSARILTGDRYSFTYGKVEARIQVPGGKGLWPAFWMIGSDCNEVGWPECGEIDIMEINGGKPTVLHGTIHGPGSSGPYGLSHTFTSPGAGTFTNSFHVYAVEWDAKEIRWYVDRALYAVERKTQFSQDQPWVFDHPFIILLNLAVGGDWPGNPDDTITFPQSMKVDYVRVYQHP